jgi:hypothetical protein
MWLALRQCALDFLFTSPNREEGEDHPKEGVRELGSAGPAFNRFVTMLHSQKMVPSRMTLKK